MIIGVDGKGCVADCCCQLGRVVAFREKTVLFNVSADAFSNNSGAFGTGFGQKSGKFIAAVTEQNIGFTNTLSQQAGDLLEGLTSGQVPTGIVDCLKPVDIDKD